MKVPEKIGVLQRLMKLKSLCLNDKPWVSLVQISRCSSSS